VDASESLALDIGAKVERFMSKKIQYSDEPIGDVKVIPDFLPSPEQLALKNKQTKVTISLSSESIAFFKAAAKKHHMQYQKMIRQLLDEYVEHQKDTHKE
jgi:predicted DNA binding CopG/RHH family protein